MLELFHVVFLSLLLNDDIPFFGKKASWTLNDKESSSRLIPTPQVTGQPPHTPWFP